MDDPYPGLTELTAIFLSLDLYFLGINLIIILILFGLSALVSGSEVAYFSLSQDEIDECKESDSIPENRIAQLLTNPKRLLATILILNNFVNIAIVMLSANVTWQITGTKDTEGAVLALLTALVTVAIVFVGEIVPKIYANQNSQPFAKFTSGLLSISYGL